ncbi:MAG: fibrobacter succinogenes major paralogous domain-containing protein [Odoribacteraceae bacterium]|nr:fibrobacter succinogenes major paralogous domain-containing protein [Odoribacteraceae bacterium]
MNTSRVYLLALATCAVAACAEGPVGRPDTGGEGREARVTLSINAVPEAPGTSDTRAVTDAVEEGTGPGYKVTDFWVLQFTGTTDDAMLATAPRYYTMSEFETNGSVISVILPPGGKTYRYVLLANTHNATLDDGGLRNVATLGALKNVSLPIQKVEDMYNDGNGDDLLMNGFIDVIGGSVPGSLACDLYRNVAKFTLQLINSPGSGVTITSVQLCNVPDRLSYADQLLTTVSPRAGFINLLPVDTFDPPLEPNPSEQPTLARLLHYYLPRNCQGINPGVEQPHQKNLDAPTQATYVQIMGQLANGTPLRYRFYPGANTTTDFNIEPNYHYLLPVAFNGAGGSGDSRVENLGQVNLADANSYIINPLPIGQQTTYGVPVAERVNDFWNKTIGEGNAISPATQWVAEVIWQDRGGSRLIDFCSSTGTVTPGNTSFAGTGSGRFYFKPAGPGVKGNVLIGVRKSGETTYLWSWHLWITDYNPDEAPSSWQADKFAYNVPGGNVHHYTGGWWATSTYNNKFIMDRNLGAASADRAQGVANTRGLYYQFGRKDPFPATNSPYAPVTLYDITGATGPTIPITVNKSSFEGAVKDPARFYATGSGGGDWLLTNPYHDALWNNPSTWNPISTTGKSFFDPCPPGWKLPVIGTWDEFTHNNVNNPGSGASGYNENGFNAGWEFYLDNVLKNAYAYQPAAGYRYANSGSTNGERLEGYLWTATPDGSAHGRMFWTYYTTAKQDRTARGNGSTARCVQE